MSARIFFAGAAVGAIAGALAVVAFQTQRAPAQVTEDAITAAVRNETALRSDSPPARAPVNVVQSATDRSVPTVPEPGRIADVAPPSSSDPGDEVIRTDAEMRARGESMEQLGDNMKSEARDDAWAPNMENELRDFLARTCRGRSPVSRMSRWAVRWSSSVLRWEPTRSGPTSSSRWPFCDAQTNRATRAGAEVYA